MNSTIISPEDAACFSTASVKSCLRSLATDWSNLPLSEVRNPRNRSKRAKGIEAEMTVMMDVLVARGINPDHVA